MRADVVGRQRGLAAIEQFLDCLAGQPRALVLEGEPGIGKTTLWLADLDDARRRGYRVLSCQPSAAEQHLSYGSLADLLAEIEAADLDMLPEPQRQALDFVLLRTKAGTAVTDHRAAGAALLSILDRLADDMPVLVAFDDLQWVDGSSAKLIEFALRRLSERIGVLAAMRADKRAEACVSVQLRDPGVVTQVPVGPLSLGALHEMLRVRLGRSFPRPVLARIEHVSAGNPFYALELARSFEQDGAAKHLQATGNRADQPGWARQMAKRRRKTLIVCRAQTRRASQPAELGGVITPDAAARPLAGRRPAPRRPRALRPIPAEGPD
jgi:predicted ATPase